MSSISAWTLIDATNRPMHVSPKDYCYYYYEYAPRMGYTYSRANSAVLNYKIKPEIAANNPSRKRYKTVAIAAFAQAIATFLSNTVIQDPSRPLARLGRDVALIPLPPSHPKRDIAQYDMRNVQTCEMVSQELGIAFCDELDVTQYIGQAHSGGSRNPDDLYQHLQRTSFEANSSQYVFLVDDIITTGAHFVAAKKLLLETGCTENIYGLFLARAVYPQPYA